MAYMRSILSTKNQITLPREVREALSINPRDVVGYTVEGDMVYMKKIKNTKHCPICSNGVFKERKCIICDGEGYLDVDISINVLMSKLNTYILDENIEGFEFKKDDLLGYKINVLSGDEYVNTVANAIKFEILRCKLIAIDELTLEDKTYIKDNIGFQSDSLDRLLNMV